MGAHLLSARLRAADMAHTSMARTELGDLDLSETRGLSDVVHNLPSTAGIDTITTSWRFSTIYSDCLG